MSGLSDMGNSFIILKERVKPAQKHETPVSQRQSRSDPAPVESPPCNYFNGVASGSAAWPHAALPVLKRILPRTFNPPPDPETQRFLYISERAVRTFQL